MATRTQTMRKPVMQQERLHDYLYDNHYVLSGERDHARATFKAHTGNSRVEKLPVFRNMFSDLRHFPRYSMRLDTTDPVPKFVSRQWRGYAEQQREALIRHTTFNYDPLVRVPPKHYAEVSVGGTERHKYFKRPIIPFLQQIPPYVQLADSRYDPLSQMDGGASARGRRAVTPPVRTQQTQTDYRESEAQTDPYTPEYVVRPGSQPELLTLATLSFGKGLPAGLAEVEMIERARAKRAWEATLPPLNDTSQLERRKKMMEDMEHQEWALREREIERLQEARLEVLKQLLKQREEHHHELNVKRLDRICAYWSKRQEEKNRAVKKIRNEHLKAIRRITAQRRKVENRLERRDITYDYSDPGSQAFAPLTRIGVFLDRGSEAYNVKSKYLTTYAGLLELESSLPDFVTQPRVKAPKPRNIKIGPHYVKRKYRLEKELMEVHEFLREQRNRVEEPPKPLRFLTRIEKPVPRPPTPSVEIPSPEEEDRELGVVYLQQLLRGRAIQNMMFEGKEKRIELIRELRTTHALQDAESRQKKQEKQATLALQRQRRLHEHKENFVDEILSQLEGESIGDTLDFLSKELIRLQEERRIHAFCMLAERQRRIREAEESGKRQVEERRRREEDEIFKQVVKAHQDTVDTYLEDIILETVDRAADKQARREVRELAGKINEVAHEVESRKSLLESEEIVSELVHGFLLPEVAKQEMRERVAQKQRKHLLAAHREIHGTGSGIVDKGNGSPPPSPPEYTEKYATQSSEEQLDSDQLPEAADYTEKYPKESGQEEEDFDLDLEDPELQAAATKIQAAFRGHLVRHGTIHEPAEGDAKEETGAEVGEESAEPGEQGGSVRASRASLVGSNVEVRASQSRGSRASVTASKAGLPSSQAELDGAKTGSQPALDGSRTGSRGSQTVISGSKTGSKAGSKTGSKTGSRAGSKAGSQSGLTGSRAAVTGSQAALAGVTGSQAGMTASQRELRQSKSGTGGSKTASKVDATGSRTGSQARLSGSQVKATGSAAAATASGASLRKVASRKSSVRFVQDEAVEAEAAPVAEEQTPAADADVTEEQAPAVEVEAPEQDTEEPVTADQAADEQNEE